MVFDALLQVVDNVLPQTLINILLLGYAGREFLADDIRPVAASGRILPDDGTDVEAFAVTVYFLSGLGPFQGVEVVFLLTVDIVENDTLPFGCLRQFQLSLELQCIKTTHQYTDE
jgi:hypothetical protein